MSEFAIIVFSVIGLIISYLIFNSKNRNEKLVCVIGKDCNKVIRSKYSVTLGFRNEVLGMIFYSLLAITSILILFIPELINIDLITTGRLIVTGIAALLSVYLTYIQIFVLKEYCEYCWATNLINVIIFFIILF